MKVKMGFWGKVKGVLGRVGSGIKKGWNWLTHNKDKVMKAADSVAGTVADVTGNDKLKQFVDTNRGRVDDVIGKGERIRQMISGLHS